MLVRKDKWNSSMNCCRGRVWREHIQREKRVLGGWKPYGCIQVALCVFAERH